MGILEILFYVIGVSNVLFYMFNITGTNANLILNIWVIAIWFVILFKKGAN